MNEDARIAFDGTAALDLGPTLVKSAAQRVEEKARNEQSDFPLPLPWAMSMKGRWTCCCT